MPTYVTPDEVRDIAGALPGLSQLIALEDDTLAAYAELASDRFDTARRYQGRKFEASQTLEFPRVARGTGLVGNTASPNTDPRAIGISAEVWDWDSTTNAAVAPAAVKRAVVYE